MKNTVRGKVIMALCAVLVAALALLPLAWFAFQDSRLFGTVSAADTPYDHRAVTGEDFYLLNQVKARAQAFEQMYQVYESVGYQSETAPYTGAGNCRGAMQQSSGMSNYAASLLRSLNEAGALPDAWYEEAVSGMLSYDTRLYTSSDSLGITRLILFPHDSSSPSDNYYNETPRFALDFEPKTGKVLGLWIQVPAEGDEASARADDLTAAMDAQTVLDAWVEWEGLSALGDWAMPARGQYAGTGVYSPGGEALLTCVNGTYTEDETRRAYYSMQLNWQPRSPDFVPDGGENLVPQEAQRLSASDGTAMYTIEIAPAQAADGSYVYCEWNRSDTPYIILRTDFADGEQRPFCDAPGCDHLSESCPARLPIGGYAQTSVAASGGKLYVFLSDALSDRWLVQGDLAKLSDEEIMRRFYAANKNVPEALYTDELPAYTAQDVTDARWYLGGEAIDTQIWVLDGGEQRLLADLGQTSVKFQWEDDAYFYGVQSTDDAAEYGRWVRLNKTTGEYETMPIPDADEVVGVSNGKLILFAAWYKEPLTADLYTDCMLADGHGYSARSDNREQHLLLYDPQTDELRNLFCEPGAWTRVTAVYGKDVYLNYEEINGTESHSIRLDTETGQIKPGETIFQVSLESEYADYHFRGNLSYDCGADNWIIWEDGYGNDPEKALLMNLDTGLVSKPPLRADPSGSGRSYTILAAVPDDRLLLSWFEPLNLTNYDFSLGQPWHVDYRQYLAPSDDLSELTPIQMWQPGT